MYAVNFLCDKFKWTYLYVSFSEVLGVADEINVLASWSWWFSVLSDE